MANFTIDMTEALTGASNSVGSFDLEGTVTMGGGGSTRPTDQINIISTEESVDINFSWTQTGRVWRLLDNDLTWEYRVFLEKMGPGDDPTIDEQKENFDRGATGGPFVVNYSASINLANLPEGLYLVTATLMLKGPSGEPTRIAAFADLGRLQVFNVRTPATPAP